MNYIKKIKKISAEMSLLDDTRLKIIEDAIINCKNIHNEDSLIWDLGVYKGGSSLFMQMCLLENKMKNSLYIFDTFDGIPNKSEFDIHNIGDIKGSNYERIKTIFKPFKNVKIFKGKIPETFEYLENSKISMVHIDLDNYDSVKSSLEFTYPRVLPGGYIIIDDYNCGSCPGAKKATEEFLLDKPEKLILGEGHGNPQAFFIKI